MRERVKRWVGAGGWAVLAVGAVAFAHALGWSLLTPAFHAPDEPGHFGYVQYVAETGRLPGREPEDSAKPSLSSEITTALGQLGFGAVRGYAIVRIGQEAPRAPQPGVGLPRDDAGGPNGATPQPPGYYALAAVPYAVGGGLPLGQRLWLVRLFSVLAFALTAALCVVLVRGALGAPTGVAVVAGLGVALHPGMAFVGGGVSPDALLAYASVATVTAGLAVLRAPSIRRLGGFGAIVGFGALTKLTFVGVLPAAALVIVLGSVALWRRAGAREGIRGLLVGGALAAAPGLCFLAYLKLTGGVLLPAGPTTPFLAADLIAPASRREMLSYIWQLYLPRTPIQLDLVVGFGPIDVWATGLAGQYGWLDYGAPVWIRDIAVTVWCLLAAGAAAWLIGRRDRLWHHRFEFLTLGVFTAGLLGVIGFAGYDYRRQTGQPFEQARYVFPLAGHYALVIGAALLALRRRVRAVAAGGVAAFAIAHALSGMLLTLSRYYA